ncbi:MAG: hypothetical protein D6725_02870, partial [Planctomycetota bacterium]
EEWRAITALVERLFERLSAVRRDHRLKSMRVEAALNRACSGTRREDILQQLQQRHQAVDDTDLDALLRSAIRESLADLQRRHPDLIASVRRLRKIGAVARPAVTVALYSVIGPVVHVPGVEQVLVERLADVAVTLSGDAVIGVSGERALQALAQRTLQRVYESFTRRRLDWLRQNLRELLLAEVEAEFEKARSLARHPARERLRRHLAAIEARLKDVPDAQGDGP